jgi:dipeptide transport system substrate-binding protein
MPYPNPADIEAMKKHPDINVLEQPGLNIGYLAYNTTKKPFDDKRVRRRPQYGHEQEGHH